MELSEELEKWRADRPDEWKMDEFIRKAKKIEELQRYGLPERWNEVKDALAEAGHPLCNENGHLVLNALQALIAERDNLRLEACRLQRKYNAATACGH